jgi:hypothetical protein
MCPSIINNKVHLSLSLQTFKKTHLNSSEIQKKITLIFVPISKNLETSTPKPPTASALPISSELLSNWTNTQSALHSHMVVQAAEEEMITKPFLFLFI